MKLVYAISIAALLPFGAAADQRADALEMLGWTDDGEMSQAILSIARSLIQRRGLFCGSAMTDQACEATMTNFMTGIEADPLQIREQMLDRMLPVGREAAGLARVEQEMADVPASSFDAPVCSGGSPMDNRCRIMFDLMMLGGATAPNLDAARAKAGAEVDPWFKDGRSFDE